MFPQKLSFPITVRAARSRSNLIGDRDLVVCLECGQEFPYDWNEMKVGLNKSPAAAGLRPNLGESPRHSRRLDWIVCALSAPKTKPAARRGGVPVYSLIVVTRTT